jgi:thiol-disulfide isomerase/thioredoxin
VRAGVTACYAGRVKLVSIVALLVGCSSSSAPERAGGKVEILAAPATGDLATYVAGEVQRGERDRVPVLVYVGATWCQPCKELHAAATSGQLDTALGPLRLLEFDQDRDGTYLEAAGYKSAMVPLLAKPKADGRASGQQFDGVKTGLEYVPQLTTKIQGLLGAR